jgi:hypothetical protein
MSDYDIYSSTYSDDYKRSYSIDPCRADRDAAALLPWAIEEDDIVNSVEDFLDRLERKGSLIAQWAAVGSLARAARKTTQRSRPFAMPLLDDAAAVLDRYDHAVRTGRDDRGATTMLEAIQWEYLGTIEHRRNAPLRMARGLYTLAFITQQAHNRAWDDDPSAGTQALLAA